MSMILFRFRVTTCEQRGLGKRVSAEYYTYSERDNSGKAVGSVEREGQGIQVTLVTLKRV